MELEQRVANLEQIVQAIIALPQLSVRAMQESQKQIESFKEIIKHKKKELKIATIPPTRRELTKDIEDYEYLISPAICTDFLYSNQQDSSTENSLRHSQPSSELDEDTIRETILDIIRILDGLSYADAKIILDLTSKALVPTMRVKYPEDPEEAMREYYNQSGNKFA